MGEKKSGVVTIAEAARVLKVDQQTVRLLLQNQMVSFGIAYKRPGSTKFSYKIFAEPFCALTGYKNSDG